MFAVKSIFRIFHNSYGGQIAFGRHFQSKSGKPLSPKLSSKPSNTPHPPKDPPDDGYNPESVEHSAFHVPDFIRPAAFRKFNDPFEVLGPDANKKNVYKNSEYFAYHRYSFVELQNHALRLRDELRESGGLPVKSDTDEESDDSDDEQFEKIKGKGDKSAVVGAAEAAADKKSDKKTEHGTAHKKEATTDKDKVKTIGKTDKTKDAAPAAAADDTKKLGVKPKVQAGKDNVGTETKVKPQEERKELVVVTTCVKILEQHKSVTEIEAKAIEKCIELLQKQNKSVKKSDSKKDGADKQDSKAAGAAPTAGGKDADPVKTKQGKNEPKSVEKPKDDIKEEAKLSGAKSDVVKASEPKTDAHTTKDAKCADPAQKKLEQSKDVVKDETKISDSKPEGATTSGAKAAAAQKLKGAESADQAKKTEKSECKEESANLKNIKDEATTEAKSSGATQDGVKVGGAKVEDAKTSVAKVETQKPKDTKDADQAKASDPSSVANKAKGTENPQCKEEPRGLKKTKDGATAISAKPEVQTPKDAKSTTKEESKIKDSEKSNKLEKSMDKEQSKVVKSDAENKNAAECKDTNISTDDSGEKTNEQLKENLEKKIKEVQESLKKFDELFKIDKDKKDK